MAAAAGDGAVKPLQSAMKLANGAIELDTGNRPREAYTEYLRSIHYISQVLLEEAEMTKEAGETVPLDTSKMLKLAEQCLERAQSTAAKLGKPCLKPAKPMTAAVPSPTSRHRRVYSDEGGKLSPFLPPEIFQKLQMVESQNSKKELTPLEEASLQNQKLKAAYEARMARLDPTQAVQKTSLTLSLQRQMMENLVIAKAREETLQRKMEERRLRLQEAANRTGQSSGGPSSRGALGTCHLSPAWSPTSSDTEGPVAPGSRRLRASQSLHCVLCPPEPALRPQDGPPNRGADGSPKGPPSPLGDAMSRLRDKDSSFEDLEQFLATSERWGLSPGGQSESQNPGVKREPLLEQLKSTVKDIHNAIDRLLSLTLLAFEGLNTAAAKDRCLACMEEAFFSPLWAPLLALYRSVHRAREVALSRSMELYRNTAPTALGVPAKLLPQDAEAQGTGTYPYHAAVQELGLLVLESCPQKKLECIVRALRVICACAEDCCRAQEASVPPGAAAIGADDLLPILSFVVLRSGLPQLVSECAALEEFVHEGYLIGEEGYCLTSLQSALSYVELLPQGALGK
ncbi:VPS9 domain-containing protein 1 isoform X3 [Elephas maximus indicus]|uniref:VPS9 domain-containing protein 1 isoform X3 n=1 Tax=Elephas maximus indicus TaxID=99487 RepID=UPI00211624DE|nr:VPS9 domain-containing protein 1 isoform X3 [Elephas maximus indicus]